MSFTSHDLFVMPSATQTRLALVAVKAELTADGAATSTPAARTGASDRLLAATRALVQQRLLALPSAWHPATPNPPPRPPNSAPRTLVVALDPRCLLRATGDQLAGAVSAAVQRGNVVLLRAAARRPGGGRVARAHPDLLARLDQRPRRGRRCRRLARPRYASAGCASHRTSPGSRPNPMSVFFSVLFPY